MRNYCTYSSTCHICYKIEHVGTPTELHSSLKDLNQASVGCGKSECRNSRN